MIKTFRGMLHDETEQKINLHTNDGKKGYKIIKFQVIPNNPGGQDPEAIMLVSTESTVPSGLIDFSDTALLAAAYYSGGSTTTKPQDSIIIFDQQIFNQDIFITLNDDSDNESMNYYLELEQVELDLNESTVATLQSIKNTAGAALVT